MITSLLFQPMLKLRELEIIIDSSITFKEISDLSKLLAFLESLRVLKIKKQKIFIDIPKNEVADNKDL